MSLFDEQAAPTVFTREMKIEAVKREIGMRKRNYPRWVADRKMSQLKANSEIAVMEAILADYEAGKV